MPYAGRDTAKGSSPVEWSSGAQSRGEGPVRKVKTSQEKPPWNEGWAMVEAPHSLLDVASQGATDSPCSCLSTPGSAEGAGDTGLDLYVLGHNPGRELLPAHPLTTHPWVLEPGKVNDKGSWT
ncbi:UNVERIFIED_CONTAM: hypothetical protein K2H54_042695 [Gekko kuhli]